MSVVKAMRVLMVIAFVVAAFPTGLLAQQERQAAPLLDPAQAAIAYSVFESRGQFQQLYQHMHSDARNLIPEAAVVGWYQNDFSPRGPGVISVHGLSMVSWTWEVTGRTYTNTAEVIFSQPFADGTVVTDVVRLVPDQGEWRWFFGRSRAFVDEQIARFGSSSASVPVPAGNPSRFGAVTPDQLLSAPFHADVLPAGFGFGGVSPTLIGPFFGTTSDGFGATWLDASVGPQATKSVVHSFLTQYAVFDSEQSALNAFMSPTFSSRFGKWPFGSQTDSIYAGAWSSQPAIRYWDSSLNTGTGLGSSSVTAGTAMLVANVIVITQVSLGGFANMVGSMPSIDDAMFYAMQMAEASARHIQRLNAGG